MKWLNILIVLLISGLLLIKINENEYQTRKLYFSTTSLPFSSDPLDYDAYVHYYSFTSVFAGLVSLQKIGQVTPALAKEWSHNSNFFEWRFKIREDLTYSNGDLITLSDVYSNMKRVAYLMKVHNSQSGLFEFLVGFQNIKNMQEDIEGIQIDQNELILKFSKAMPDLLEKISFGFYSLAHPSLYNKENGEWIDKKKVISSGPYEVSVWGKDTFELILRKNIPYISYKDSVEQIVFTDLLRVKNSDDLKGIAIVVADGDSLMVDDNFRYINSPIGLNISYVRCYGCEKEDSQLMNLEIRRWLRQRFYDNLKENGLNPTYSFFPLVLNGVSEIHPEIFKKPSFKKFNVVTHKYANFLKIVENESRVGPVESMAKAFYGLKEDVNLILEEYTNKKKFSDFDIIAKSTGIEADDYMETVKFMFLSNHGIKLPDVSGKIKNELAKKNPDIQVINQELWDQAIIWPVRHFNKGFWVNRNYPIDYSQLNTNHPAIDFQFIKWE